MRDWFRFYSDFINDPKIGRLPEQVQLVFVKCMCLEAKGYLDPSHADGVDDDIAVCLKIETSEWLSLRDTLLSKALLTFGINGYKTNYQGGLITESKHDKTPDEWLGGRS